MDYSLGLFFFLYLSVCSLALLLNPGCYRDAVNDLLSSKGQMLIVGFIALIFGAFIIAFYSKYSMSWTLLITVVGWLSFIKGIMYLVFPNVVKKLAGIYDSEKALRINGIIVLIVALYFGYCIFI